jgi:hypothetical protein
VLLSIASAPVSTGLLGIDREEATTLTMALFSIATVLTVVFVLLHWIVQRKRDNPLEHQV